MKAFLQRTLQSVLTLEGYLFLIALLKTMLFRFRRGKEGQPFLYFLSQVSRDAVVLDIGANIGFTTRLLAQRAKQVHSFEPMPSNFRTLQRIVRFYGLKNVRTYQYALGDADGSVEMAMPIKKGSVRMHAYSHVIHDGYKKTEVAERFTVPSKQLDNLDLGVSNGLRISAIKIDVEGFESHVFAGAQTLIAKHRPIIYCELAGQENREKTFTLFRDLGYRVTVYEAGSLTNYDPLKNTDWNFFLIPN